MLKLGNHEEVNDTQMITFKYIKPKEENSYNNIGFRIKIEKVSYKTLTFSNFHI